MGFILEDKKTGRVKMASDKSMIGKKSTGKGRNAAPRNAKPFREALEKGMKGAAAGGGAGAPKPKTSKKKSDLIYVSKGAKIKTSNYYAGGGKIYTGRD